MVKDLTRVHQSSIWIEGWVGQGLNLSLYLSLSRSMNNWDCVDASWLIISPQNDWIWIKIIILVPALNSFLLQENIWDWHCYKFGFLFPRTAWTSISAYLQIVLPPHTHHQKLARRIVGEVDPTHLLQGQSYFPWAYSYSMQWPEIFFFPLFHSYAHLPSWKFSIGKVFKYSLFEIISLG